MMTALEIMREFLALGRKSDDHKVSFWKLRYRGRGQKKAGVRKIGVLRPWQAKQWFGPLMFDGKAVTPQSLETRQRRRQALRILCMKQITEKYSSEPRKFRRRIARRLAVKAFGEMRVAA
jgi:hypothetical protein